MTDIVWFYTYKYCKYILHNSHTYIFYHRQIYIYSSCIVWLLICRLAMPWSVMRSGRLGAATGALGWIMGYIYIYHIWSWYSMRYAFMQQSLGSYLDFQVDPLATSCHRKDSESLKMSRVTVVFVTQEKHHPLENSHNCEKSQSTMGKVTISRHFQ